MQPKNIILPSFYAGNIYYFSKIIQYPILVIEQHEHFVKSTPRNRTYIASTQGALRLSIPLKKGKQQRSIAKNVQISYDHNWQKNHWNSLTTCYNSSPYFEYYEHYFQNLYTQPTHSLLQLNMELLHIFFKILTLSNPPTVEFTQKYHKTYPADQYTDLRNFDFEQTLPMPPYYQVFETKTGFLPNLSIFDLIFNTGGKQALQYLQNINI